MTFSQKLEKLWSSPAEFKTPESVLYNADQEMIFVSNIGPTKDVKNGDGFISLLSTDGEIENLHWVKGLNDPKGIAVWGKNLYVADMNELVVIEYESAKIVKKYPIPKAKFLNDVTALSKNMIFISDMLDQRIYLFNEGNITSWKYDPKLENVNGLWAEKGKIYAGNNSVWEIDIETQEMKELFGNTGGIDGLQKLGENDFIFSNWIGKIFISKNGEIIKLLDTSDEKINSADIYFAPESGILYVPTFNGNTIDAYKLVW
jgi:DNA-binding beta-propeller fold protein YncE